MLSSSTSLSLHSVEAAQKFFKVLNKPHTPNEEKNRTPSFHFNITLFIISSIICICVCKQVVKI